MKNMKRNKIENSSSPLSFRNTQSTGIHSNTSNQKKKILIKKSVQLTKPKIKETEKEKEIIKEKPNQKEKKIEKSKNIIADYNNVNIIPSDIFKDENLLNSKSNLNTIPISFGKDDLLPKEFFQDEIVSGSSFVISDIQMPNIKVENKIPILIQNLINFHL